MVVGLSGNCSRNKLERAVCDRYTSIVRDRDRFTMGREERVVQAMALSVNGVCRNGDGNGEGQSVDWDLGGVHAQGPKQFLFQPRKHLSVL